MIAKFNPTGTHVHKGFLKVRMDLYPDIGDKTYEMHHALEPDIPPEGYLGEVDKDGIPIDQIDYRKWMDGLPKVWKTSPALYAFVKVSEAVTLSEMKGFTRQVFNKDTLKTLDDVLIRLDSIHLVSSLMRKKLVLSDQKVQTEDIPTLISSVNERLTNLSLSLESDGEIIDIEPKSITIGSAAEVRDSYYSAGKSRLNLTGGASGTGSIDTVEIYVDTKMDDTEVGILYLLSATTYKCRDGEDLGDLVGSGKATLPGLDMDVEAGDFIGDYFTSGWIDRDYSGFDGVREVTGPYMDKDDEGNFSTLLTGDTQSLYGTGEEAAAEQELTAAVISVTSSVQASAIAGSGNAPLTGAVINVTSSVQNSAIAGTGIATLTAAVVGVAGSVQNSSISGLGNAPLIGAVVSVTSSVQAAAIVGSGNAPLTASSVSVTSSVQQAALTAEGEAPLTASPIAITSSVQTASISGTGVAGMAASTISVASSVQASTISGSGNAPLTGATVSVVSSVVQAVLSGSGSAPLTGATIAVVSSVQRAVIAGTGIADLIASPVTVVSSVANGTVEVLALILLASPIAVVSSVVASSVSLSWLLVCQSIGVEVSRLEINKVPVSRLEPVRLTSSKMPLCRNVRRLT